MGLVGPLWALRGPVVVLALPSLLRLAIFRGSREPRARTWHMVVSINWGSFKGVCG